MTDYSSGNKPVRLLLREMRLAAERVQLLEREYKMTRMRAMRQRDEAISAAAAGGADLVQLAEASLLSKARVRQIVVEDKWR